MSDNSNPQTGQGRALPKKEQDLFRSVVKHYETKQYKKGIKAADTVLKKFPKHGETLCMKGLVLNCMGDRDSAIALVKSGLMNDMRSHVCWHVYGLIYRAERNYNEAIKAYKQALRIDSDNIQILRDLSLLQIQMRDLSGFVQTRHTILELKPNQKINWLTFSLAKHLTGDKRGAIAVIDTYLETLDGESPDLQRNYESSELALYRNMLLAEIPDNWNEALNHLEECKDVVMDEIGWCKAKGSYLLQLQMYDEAKATYMQLLDRGSTEDHNVHSGYMCALLQMDGTTCQKALSIKGTGTLATIKALSDEHKQTLLNEYQNKLLERFPKSAAIKRIPLTLLSCDSPEWTELIEKYCHKNLARGVPSLGSDLSSLFLIKDPTTGEYAMASDCIDIKTHPVYLKIVNLVDGYIASLQETATFPNGEGGIQPPSTLLWAWYLRATLHERVAEYTAGIECTDKCLAQTPTAVDVYELKARLLKAAGDINAAADCVDEGRDLDKQDRYINNQTTKYLLQAGREETALERVALFTRHENDPAQNIFDMQTTWYELELAACYAKKNDLGKSLKKYMAVEKHFEDFNEDQFDFHAYCIRKVTLRAYVQVLRWEDKLWGHDIYTAAAEAIIQNYLRLHDNPIQVDDEEKEPDYASMTAAERKKAKALARKKKKKAEKKAEEEAKRREELEAKNKKEGKTTPPKDLDPDGKELLKKNPLEEAKKFSSTLVKNAPNRLSTWLYQYDVAKCRGKSIMALRALFKAKAIDANNGEVLSRMVEFAQSGVKKHENAAVQSVFENQMLELLDGKSVSDFVNATAGEVRKNDMCSLDMRIAVSNAMRLVKVGTSSDACSIITERGLSIRGITLEACIKSVECLKNLGDDENIKVTRDEWIGLVKSRFPLFTKF